MNHEQVDNSKEQVIPTNSRELEKYLFNALNQFTKLAIKHSIFMWFEQLTLVCSHQSINF